MKDRLSPARRSWNMSRIRGKDTSPEVAVRSFLHRVGIRYILHDRRLPGRPDIVVPAARTVVLVHGCFWHRHSGCARTTNPSSNAQFWKEKFRSNVRRDRRNLRNLEAQGWRVITIWQCEISQPGILEWVALEVMAARDERT